MNHARIWENCHLNLQYLERLLNSFFFTKNGFEKGADSIATFPIFILVLVKISGFSLKA